MAIVSANRQKKKKNLSDDASKSKLVLKGPFQREKRRVQCMKVSTWPVVRGSWRQLAGWRVNMWTFHPTKPREMHCWALGTTETPRVVVWSGLRHKTITLASRRFEAHLYCYFFSCTCLWLKIEVTNNVLILRPLGCFFKHSIE